VDKDQVRAILMSAVSSGIMEKGTMRDKQGRPFTFYYFKGLKE
jgi:hypothetical protein